MVNLRFKIRCIQKANELTTIITSSYEELAEQIYEIDKVAEIIWEKSGEVASETRFGVASSCEKFLYLDILSEFSKKVKNTLYIV